MPPKRSKERLTFLLNLQIKGRKHAPPALDSTNDLTALPKRNKKRRRHLSLPNPPARKQKRAPPAPNPAPRKRHRSFNTLRDNRLLSAFRQRYIGATPELFLQTLNHERESACRPVGEQPYNWSISVIQSSGMGKSRMIDEAANLIFAIVINIREELPEGEETYPLSDSPICGYLGGHEAKSDTLLQAEYAILLRVLFDKTVDVVGSEPGLRGLTGRALARAFAEHLKEGESEYEVGANRQNFFDAVVREATKYRSRLGSPDKIQVWTLMKELRKSCSKLVTAVSRNHITNTNACLICFDEAHTLTDATGINNRERTRTPYQNLREVLSGLTDQPLFFVFLSTNSHLGEFSPTNSLQCLHPSVRVYKGQRLIAPFTELPFDVFKEVVLKGKKELTLPVVCSTEVLTGFGRAMWYVHHHDDSGRNLFEFAMNKLSAGAPPGQLFTPSLAALAVRVGINFDATT
ncbi:hypothetical protein FRC10_001433 [Ceratobasidium sp. 414]|nr:hypothetical protein FRC10_001433 [Ceratobasidium sp. 414]